MSELSKQALKVENNTSFPNNNAGLITPTNLRTFNEDMIDSTVNQATYTADSGSWNTQIGESVTTASLSGSDIIFEKNNGDTFSINVAGGSVPPGTISGSAQVIAALPTGTVSGSSQVILEDTSYTDNGAKSFLQTDGAGTLSFQYVDTIWETFRAGESVPKGTPLYFSGSNGANPIAYAADASNPNKMPVTLIAGEVLTAGSTYEGIVLGLIEGLDLTGYTAGQTVYVAEGGGWTTNLPSGSNSITQVLGIVTKGGSGGKGLVLNPGPAQLPGLQTGYTWVGNGSNRAVSIPTGSIIPNLSGYATTGSNTFTGNQTISNVGDKNGIFFRSGSEFFAGQNGNGNFIISSSVQSKYIELNPTSGWLEVYANQTNFNNQVALRGNTEARNITTQTGNGYVAQFDGFTASLQEGYAWVGKSGGTSISVPTASFAGAVPVGVATTGSNIFIGDQTITGSVNVSGGEHLFIKRSTTGANQLLRLGATDNENNFAFIVTGSDTNPGQQVWGINTAGGIWANSFDAGVVFNSYVTASQGINISNGTFSAPLLEGYVWAGDSTGRTQAVPTSSFGGGGTDITSLNAFTASQQILNATYATTASNTFTGNQTINANLVANKVSAYNFDSIFLGSQMGGTTANGTFFGYGSTDYQFIVGAYAGGFDSELKITADNTGITFGDFNGTSYPSFLKLNTNTGANPAPILTRGVEITGSVKLTPATASTNAGYPITFVSGSTISKDSVDTLMYNPSTNTLYVSASTGQSNITPTSIGFVSGSGQYGTYSSTISKTGYTNVIEGGNYIGLSGNPSKIGAPSLASSTKPAIIALSGSAVPYVAIEFQASGSSFTDGRVTAKRRLVGEQGLEITGSFTATIPTASSESQTNLFNFAPFVGANGTTYSSANISLQDYASSGIDQTFVVEYANASFEKYTALTVGPTTGGSKAQFSINTGTGYDFDEISLTDNGGGLSTALIKADTNRIVGDTQLTGSLGISEIVNLKPQNPLPSGTIGDLAVSGSILYFYDGSWRQVSLV